MGKGGGFWKGRGEGMREFPKKMFFVRNDDLNSRHLSNYLFYGPTLTKVNTLLGTEQVNRKEKWKNLANNQLRNFSSTIIQCIRRLQITSVLFTNASSVTEIKNMSPIMCDQNHQKFLNL